MLQSVLQTATAGVISFQSLRYYKPTVAACGLIYIKAIFRLSSPCEFRIQYQSVDFQFWVYDEQLPFGRKNQGTLAIRKFLFYQCKDLFMCQLSSQMFSFCISDCKQCVGLGNTDRMNIYVFTFIFRSQPQHYSQFTGYLALPGNWRLLTMQMIKLSFVLFIPYEPAKYWETYYFCLSPLFPFILSLY